MFFWWEIFKLLLEHWYFDWQFESGKLLSSFGTSWQELVEIFQNVSSVTSVFWRQVCEFLRSWATEQLPRSFKLCEKSCTVCSRRWQPANRNIIQRSFFANIYQYWQEREYERVFYKFNNIRGRESNLFTILDTRLLEAIIQLLLRFVPGLNRTSKGQLFSPLSQASLYNYIAC